MNLDYFTGLASNNPDGHFHARVQGDWAPDTTLVSFEDLYNGPFEFNDLRFSFSNTTTSTGIPETTSMLLISLGLAGLATMQRRKNKTVRS